MHVAQAIIEDKVQHPNREDFTNVVHKIVNLCGSITLEEECEVGILHKKKVRLACAPKHPYNTKTHLALQEFRFPLNGLEGVPQPRPLPHHHALFTLHILQTLFLNNATDFSPCEGESGEVHPPPPPRSKNTSGGKNKHLLL